MHLRLCVYRVRDSFAALLVIRRADKLPFNMVFALATALLLVLPFPARSA